MNPFGAIRTGVVKALRASGKALDSVGQVFEVNPHIERLQPSTKIVKFGKFVPVVKSAFIAPGAAVVGNVNIGAQSAIWYGAVVRGDVSNISIGDGVTVGDRAMIHSDETPATIGNNVIIGAGAIVHGCSIGDEVHIGEGAQVLDGSKVEKHAIVAPGAVVLSGKIVPSGQFWSGIPAKFERQVTDEEKASIIALAKANVDLAILHAKECAKTWEQIEHEEYDFEQEYLRSPDYFRRLTPAELSKVYGEVEGHQVPGRIFDSPISGRTHPPAH